MGVAAFYNGLSSGSKRTFHPLGSVTAVEACKEVIRQNETVPEGKYDLVAIVDGTVVGWGFVWDLKTELPTFGLAVADSHHGLGLGSRLMDGVLEAARTRGVTRVQLTVVQDNERAWRMYGRRGFVRQGEHVGSDGLAYLSMIADLS